MQDERGAWLLYLVGGTSVNEAFQRAFPTGLAFATPMMLIRS